MNNIKNKKLDEIKLIMAGIADHVVEERVQEDGGDRRIGCVDHGCMFKKPRGMGTNGGKCSCFQDFDRPNPMLTHREKLLVRRLAHLYKAMGKFLEDL